MRSNWMCGVLAAAALSVPAVGQIQVYIGTPPPPPVVYEVRPEMPDYGYVWTDGYWEPYGGRYHWIAGRWMRPPYPGAYWQPTRYQRFDQGWRMYPGYWGHGDGDRYRGHEDWDDDHDRGHGNGHGRGHAYGHYKHGHDD